MTEVSPGAAWDRELSPREVMHLSPSVKRQRIRVSFERKVAVLEARAVEAPGAGPGDLPTTRTKLRAWMDADRKLWAWSAKEVDHPDSPNAELVRRFERAAEALRPGVAQTPPSEARKRVDKDLIIDGLRRQVVRLAEELRKRPALVPTI